MKTILISLMILICTCINVHAQIDHSFTYQGELIDNGSPAQGTFDITIQAFDNVDASGIPLAESIHTSTVVSAGVFTIEQVDLGSMIFDGMEMWLQISVKQPTDASYTALSPLQKMGSVPYANSLIDKGAADGQVLSFDSTNGWQPSTPNSGTDDQNISGSGLTGTNLTIGIEGGASQIIDLATLQDGTGTDDQNISGSGLSGTNLTIAIEGGTAEVIDLATLQDGGATKIDELTDAKSDSDGTNDGSSVFIGIGAGAADDSTDNQNVGVGYQSLNSNTTGFNNTANGYRSLFYNTTGFNNTANGYDSLYSNTTGIYNTANGSDSLYSNTTGIFNTANGYDSLYSNTTGNFNTANGYYSLYYNTTGSSNTAIGNNAFSSGSNFTNSTGIGFDAQPGASNTIRLGTFGVTTIGGYANWTNVSDARFKTNIQEDVPGLEFIKKLRPVTYQLDMDAIAKFNKTPDKNRLAKSESLKAAEIQSGFLAQEVEAAALSLGYDFHGVDKPKNKTSHYGLRYAEFVVPLVKAVQELANTNNKSYNQVQNHEVSRLQLQINNLKEENLQLKSRLDDIEQLLLQQTK